MKFQRLELSAFGPFTSRQLEFSARPLQLVYGPNEAGKSTTLRALTALLYGIDVRTTDAHLHEMSKLRIGASLLDAEQRPLVVTRRKGAKNTLLDAEGQPLNEAVLAPLLGGLDEKLFRQMFGLDHVRLREGAEALLRGGGQLGEVLFDASTGGRSVHTTLEQLRAEAEALYKARGQTPLLNAALSAVRESKSALAKQVLAPQAYVDQQTALSEARHERAQVAAARTTMAAEKARLVRQLALLPLLAKRDALSEELGRLATPHGGAPEALVRELEQRLAQLLAGERELPGERVMLAGLEREIALLEARVGSSVAALHALDSATKARLRKLVEARAALHTEAAELARREAEAELELATLGAALAKLPAPTAGALAALLAELEREDLAARLARAQAELDKLRGQLTRRLAPLGLSELQLEGALPGEDELAGLEGVFEQCTRERERLQRLLAEQGAEHGRLTRARDELLARGALVTRAELAQVRAERDRALDALLMHSAVANLRVHAALSERADVLADRMVAEAQRAAELASLELAIGNLERERGEHTRAVEQLARQEQEARQRWRALLSPWQLSERQPRAVRAALGELVALRALRAELAAASAEHAELTRRAEERAQELCAAFELAPLKLDAALRGARERLAGEAERGRERARLGAQLERRTSDRQNLRARTQVVAQELETLLERYRAELGARGLAQELAPDELVACFEELAQLGQHMRAAEALRARAAVLHEQRARLTAEVFALTAPLDTLEATLEQLARTAREHSQAARDLERIRGELARLDEQIAQASDGDALEVLRSELAGLERDAARARLGELDEAIDSASERLKDLDQSIGAKASGLTVLEQDSGAAELAERHEQDLAHARALTRRYVEVKLALSLLSREVERYRSEHQAPVLKRAQELFKRLTLQRYRGLKVEYDNDDAPVLACMLGGQTSVRMSGLSDGTRDQLYLALRVASIERYCEQRPALPLILDDVLLHFDDARAAVALEVLAELGAHTQVLFFTHHARMVELARATLPEDALELHELAPRALPRSDGPLFESKPLDSSLS
jgi:uncharacterized protein YhaN